MILSRGKEEKKETAKNRLTYGILGLLFLGLVEGWSRIIVSNNLGAKVTEVAGSLFGLAFFFAAPIAIFFLMLGAYYYITSAGDEERAKKGKQIVINTLIATLILIASFSFIQEIANFKL